MYALRNVEWPFFSGSEVEGALVEEPSQGSSLALGKLFCLVASHTSSLESKLGSKQQNVPLPQMSTGKFAVWETSSWVLPPLETETFSRSTVLLKGRGTLQLRNCFSRASSFLPHADSISAMLLLIYFLLCIAKQQAFYFFFVQHRRVVVWVKVPWQGHYTTVCWDAILWFGCRQS